MLNAETKEKGLSRNALVVLLVMGIALVLGVQGLLLPALAVRMHPHHRPRCLSNLKQLGYACMLYSRDNAGAFPPRLAALYPVPASDREIFVCPSSRHLRKLSPVSDKRPEALPAEDVYYCYVGGLQPGDPPDTILAFGEESNHDWEGTYVLTLGLQVSWESDLEALHARLDEQAKAFRAQGREVRLIRPPWSRWPERPDLPPARGGRGGGIGIENVLVLVFVLMALGFAAIVSLRLLRRRA